MAYTASDLLVIGFFATIAYHCHRAYDRDVHVHQLTIIRVDKLDYKRLQLSCEIILHVQDHLSAFFPLIEKCKWKKLIPDYR